MTYNYEFIDDFDDPELGRVGKFILEKVLPNKFMHHEDDISLIVINKLTQNDLFSCEQMKPGSFESYSSHGPHSFDKDNHTMTLMVTNEF